MESNAYVDRSSHDSPNDGVRALARRLTVTAASLALALAVLATAAIAGMGPAEGGDGGEDPCDQAAPVKPNPGEISALPPRPGLNSDFIMFGGLPVTPPDGEGYVLTGTLSLAHHFVDIKVDHVLGPPLEVHRYYSSEWTERNIDQGPYRPILGQNWALNVDMQIEILPNRGTNNDEDW